MFIFALTQQLLFELYLGDINKKMSEMFNINRNNIFFFICSSDCNFYHRQSELCFYDSTISTETQSHFD